jgi:hypothetical protein
MLPPPFLLEYSALHASNAKCQSEKNDLISLYVVRVVRFRTSLFFSSWWEPAAQPCALGHSSYSRRAQKKSTAEANYFYFNSSLFSGIRFTDEPSTTCLLIEQVSPISSWIIKHPTGDLVIGPFLARERRQGRIVKTDDFCPRIGHQQR